MKYQSKQKAILILEDGSIFHGHAAGLKGTATGEVCFNTAMTGYQEIITDPSYADQIINFTFPHIGNTGTNIIDNESETPVAKGVIIKANITSPSNFRSDLDLNNWLIKKNIVGIQGLDTRTITSLVRNKGSINGIIVNEKITDKKIIELISSLEEWPGLKGADLASKVSCKKSYKWKEKSYYNKNYFHINTNKFKKSSKKHIVVIDFGVKQNILRMLADRNFKITVIPLNTSYEDIVKLKPDGIFLSNGPGDPMATSKITNNLLNKLFKINSITEADMNEEGVSGYLITAQEYNADAYTEEALTEFQTAPNTNLANPRNFGAITNLTSISSDTDSTTPFVQLRWTVPTGLTETFEIYVGDNINNAIADREFNISFRTSTGPFTEGATITHKVFDIDFTDTLVFWVRPINQFARGAFSNAYDFGVFRPGAGGITSGVSGIIVDPNDTKNPYGVVNRFTQIRYGDSNTGSNMRDGFTDINAVQQIGYAGSTINTITRTGGTDGSGSITFPTSFNSGTATTEEQELSFTGTRGNVTQKELLHINLADDIQNTTVRKAINNAQDWNATGFLVADSSNNSVKVNGTLELASLVAGGVSSGFGRSVCIGTSTIYVMSTTELFSFRLITNTWSHYATTNSGGVQNFNVSAMGDDVLLYNSSTTEGQIWSYFLIPPTTGATGGAQFN